MRLMRQEVMVSFFTRDFRRHRILQHVVEPTSLPVGPCGLHHPDSFQLLDQRDRSADIPRIDPSSVVDNLPLDCT